MPTEPASYPEIGRGERLLRNPVIFLGGAAVVGVISIAVIVFLALYFKDILASPLGLALVVMGVVLFILIQSTALCILAERKLSAYVQDRVGPDRIGYLGLLQPIADGVKMLMKEQMIPTNVDRPLFLLAPALAFGLSLLGFAVIPWAGNVHWPWMAADQPAVSTQVANIDIGVLYIVAVASMGVYAVVLAGYASNNKFSFYGGMRAAAQMISYEVPLGLGLLCILLTAGGLRLDHIVNEQAHSGLWFVFYQPIAFLLMLIGAFAETNRAPFDLAEAEQELVGGYHTEYSGLKFGLFFLGEYGHMLTNSALLIALFLGGWHLWFLPSAENHTWWAMLLRFGVYWLKIALFIGFYMLVRWTLPRLRFDQLMRMAWGSLVPMGMMMLLATAILVALNLHQRLLWSLGANVVVAGLMLLWAARSRLPITGRQDNLPKIEVPA